MKDINWQEFHKVKVLVIGDVMIDRYLQGQVDRISPEAPVPVVLLKHTEDRLGGAANVGLNVQALGASLSLCSCVGQDEGAEALMRLMQAHELSTEAILSVEGRKTTVKTRIMASAQQLLRVDDEMSSDLIPEHEQRLMGVISRQIEQDQYQVIILQDYNKGVLTPAIIRHVLGLATSKGIPVAVDPKDRNFWAYQGVTLFKPNLKEISRQYPEKIDGSISSLQAASRFIRQQLNNRYTMITLSDKGVFIDDEHDNYLQGTTPRTIADVSGAGDTVISVAAVGLALGIPARQLALLANLAGGQVCEKPGVVTVDKAILEQEYEQFIRI
jgi:D-glycero-beta-D-manno-heptose-7-phosphate kinase